MADGKERPIHENHRARMQERVAHNGMESLAEHEVLEYMLYLAIPRQDTNPLAHRLIDHFGSFCRVMEATPQELMQVKGVGPRSAQLISDIMEFGRYYAVKKRKKQATLDTTANAIEYINHPTGPALPSATDQLTTLKIMQLLAPAGISILDHIIVAGENACSMADRGRLPDINAHPGILNAASTDF